MRKIQDKDPLRLKSNPASGKVYTALTISLVLLAGSAILFTLNFFSPAGTFVREYNSDIYNWNTDRISQKLSQFQLSFKIMPITDMLRNRDQFIFENKVTVNAEDQGYAATPDFFNYDQSYFWYNNTVKNFPQFVFDADAPDVEEAEDFCIHLWWNPPKREKAYAQFTDVIGQPTCNNGNSSTKYIWKTDDPTTGINFKPWRKVVLQNSNCNSTDACKKGCEALNGRISKKTGECIAYDILKRICVSVDMMYSENGKNSAIILDGGCYAEGQVGYYKRALPDKIYKLEYVPVEVRDKFDPYTALTSQNYYVQTTVSPRAQFLGNVSYILLAAGAFFAFITLILYFQAKSDAGEEGHALRH